MAEATESLHTRAGRWVDYIFGRNAMIGIASLMLLVISGYATWHGMRDFIVGVSAAQQQPGEGFSVSNDILVIAIVVALTFLMWLALREVFGVKRRLSDRLVMAPLYVFLLLWSIGFGYGFWWSLISGEEATRTGLSGLQEDARDASSVITARLEAVRSNLDNVVAWSDGQMSREETGGGSCGVPSGAGRGPLYNARKSVRDTVTSLRDGMVRAWLGPVQTDVEQLGRLAQGLGAGGTVEERQQRFERTAADIRGRARNIAARSNELGRSTAAQMKALAESVSIAPGQPGFTCYDPTLAQRLQAAAEQANQPATVRLREAAFNEGPAGVANAVKNLWRNMGVYIGSLASWVFTGKAGGTTDGGDPITGRDMIALLATIGVDLGLLALAILNPPKEPPPIRPPGALVRQINEAIETAIARAPGADREWVRRHFVHHNRASYFVIPNLYSCNPDDPEEAGKAMAINQLAGVLSDLDLVTWPERRWPAKGPIRLRKSELERLADEEALDSTTDLARIRKKWAEEHKLEGAELESYVKRREMRNHGLFSKAERALQIAGWSERARNDVEIFRVVEAEGLTPLLMVLSEPSLSSREAGQTQRAAAPIADPAPRPSSPRAPA
ncbi:MAG: hypothetical protein SFW09_05145 [Hyphomicrobiaceae bacterium]|nr:hypothetical protein [Hyphomicrobiaceae bacterium]